MATLYFLIGPTAVGKTALAVKWAMVNNADILCADSPLAYREMDIGTAKPTLEERKKVRHYGVDLVGINERFSVGEYAEYAAKLIKDMTARNKDLLVVGGSGFYLKSFFKAPTDGIPISNEIILEVEKIFKESGLEGLLKKLRKVGGKDLTGLDLINPRRVMKALERVLGGKQSYQELRRIYESKLPPYVDFGKKVVMLTRPVEELQKRIERRTKAMLAGGFVDEVRRLDILGIRKNPQAAGVIGYRETLEYLDGKLTLSGLESGIIRNTLMLVRKQRTFFKQLPVNKVILLREEEEPAIGTLFAL